MQRTSEKGPIFVAGKLNLPARVQSNGADLPTAVTRTNPHLLPDSAPLPRRHRVLIALYTLELGRQPRAEILAVNDVTESDLAEFQADWLRMRRRRRASAA